MLWFGGAADVFSRQMCHRSSEGGTGGAFELVLFERFHHGRHHVAGQRVAVIL